MLFAFDCDGVLVDSEIIASEVDAELLTEVGYEITPEEVTRRFAGLTSRDDRRDRRGGDRPAAAGRLPRRAEGGTRPAARRAS